MFKTIINIDMKLFIIPISRRFPFLYLWGPSGKQQGSREDFIFRIRALKEREGGLDIFS